MHNFSLIVEIDCGASVRARSVDGKGMESEKISNFLAFVYVFNFLPFPFSQSIRMDFLKYFLILPP